MLVQTQRRPVFSTSQASWGAPDPKIEARALLQLLGRNGVTVEDIRELIAIPPETEQHLQAYVRANPEERPNVERVLRFRESVWIEFQRLYRSHQAWPASKQLALPSVPVRSPVPQTFNRTLRDSDKTPLPEGSDR